MDAMQEIRTYEAISSITGRMVEAARASDWDLLATLEHDCSGLVNGLRAADGRWTLNHEQRQRKVALIRKVLADDAEIRSLTEPWLEKLAALLGTAGRETRLHRAYDPTRWR